MDSGRMGLGDSDDGQAQEILCTDDAIDGDEKARAKGEEQNDLLFSGESHAPQGRHWQDEDCNIGDDIDWSGRDIEGDNVNTLCTWSRGNLDCGNDRATLHDVNESQDQAGYIDEPECEAGSSPEKGLSFT